MRHCVSERLITLNLSFLVAQLVKNLPAMQETWDQYLGQEDPLEKEMAAHSSILAWGISWTEEPGRVQSMGAQRVGHNLATKPPPLLSTHLQDYFKHKEGPPLHTGEVWGSLPRGNDGYIDSERQREKNK